MLWECYGSATGVLRESYGKATGVLRESYGNVTGPRWECYGSNTDVIRGKLRDYPGGLPYHSCRRCLVINIPVKIPTSLP